MTNISGMFSDVYSLTAKIHSLRQQDSDNSSNLTNKEQTINAENAILDIQKSFSAMLNSLMFSSNDDEDEKSYDPFASFNAFDQTSINPYLSNNPGLSFLNTPELDFTV